MEGTKTTVQVDVDTWRKLQALKLSPQDNINAVIRRLLERESAGEASPKRQAG